MRLKISNFKSSKTIILTAILNNVEIAAHELQVIDGFINYPPNLPPTIHLMTAQQPIILEYYYIFKQSESEIVQDDVDYSQKFPIIIPAFSDPKDSINSKELEIKDSCVMCRIHSSFISAGESAYVTTSILSKDPINLQISIILEFYQKTNTSESHQNITIQLSNTNELLFENIQTLALLIPKHLPPSLHWSHNDFELDIKYHVSLDYISKENDLKQLRIPFTVLSNSIKSKDMHDSLIFNGESITEITDSVLEYDITISDSDISNFKPSKNHIFYHSEAPKISQPGLRLTCTIPVQVTVCDSMNNNLPFCHTSNSEETTHIFTFVFFKSGQYHIKIIPHEKTTISLVSEIIPGLSENLLENPDLFWKPLTVDFPTNAFLAGIDIKNEPLYVVRTLLQGGLQLGKFGPHLQFPLIPYGGKDVPVGAESYNEILISGEGFQWVKVHEGIPLNAIPSGYESDGKLLYIARAKVIDSIIPLSSNTWIGKIVSNLGTSIHSTLCPGKAGRHIKGCNVGFGGVEFVKEMANERLLILYASQTGNAEWIAKHLTTEAKSRGFNTLLLSLNEYETLNWSTSQVMIVVTSTTGDGDPPDNAIKFWKYLRKATPLQLNGIQGMKYAILGLGDTNYTNFCNTAKRIDKKFQELGAIPFIPKALADDGIGLETVVDPWIANIWTYLNDLVVRDHDIAKNYSDTDVSVLQLSSNNKIQSESTLLKLSKVSIKSKSDMYSPFAIQLKPDLLKNISQLTNIAKLQPSVCKLSLLESSKQLQESKTIFDVIGKRKLDNFSDYSIAIPFPSTIKHSRVLTGPQAVKKVVELTIDIQGLDWKFQPGDAFAIVCPNPDDLVMHLLDRLGYEPFTIMDIVFTDEIVKLSNLPKRCTAYEVFKYFLDINSPPCKKTLRMLSEYSKDTDEKKLLLFLASKQGISDYKSISPQCPNLADVLATFPHCFPPMTALLENLHPLQPRYFSVCNSPIQTPQLVKIAFNVVDYKLENTNKRILGVCTPWLDKLQNNDCIGIFPKLENAFVLTESAPIIMIAAGTGISPFIGFLEHLQLSNSKTKTMLIYGHRYKTGEKEDCLYADEIKKWVDSNVLTRFIQCTSQEEKKYIHEAIIENQREIFEMIEGEGARIYVCGSGAMAKNVHNALTVVIKSMKSIEEMEGIKYLMEMQANGKYFREIWTVSCGQVNSSLVGKKVKLAGWSSAFRVIGKDLIFIRLRDETGASQGLLKTKDQNLIKEMQLLTPETIVQMSGTVQQRPQKDFKENDPTGGWEVAIDEFKILNKADELPYSLKANLPSEELRLQHRYLDLRRSELQSNLRKRSQTCALIRNFFLEKDFVEIETPLLFKSTPEGAREFLVPTRQPHLFYALPQSPQQYKQILMSSGFEKYFQIAKCFRDESQSSERQPEFTQVDIEVAFSSMESIISLVENLISRIWKQILNVDLKLPIHRMEYLQAMKEYGSDKPDTRFDMKIMDITPYAKFETSLQYECIIVDSLFTDELRTIKEELLSETFPQLGAISNDDIEVSLDYIKFILSDFNIPAEHPLANLKFYEKVILTKRRYGYTGAYTILGRARILIREMLIKRYQFRPKKKYEFVWVHSFPLFTPEISQSVNGTEITSWTSSHHPFTAPISGQEELLFKDKKKVFGQNYDLVLNGMELGGGSIRIHDSVFQERVFKEILLMTPERIQKDFSHLLDALRYGCPPHGGIALGLDRLMCILCGAKSIRDVIAFPKLAGKDMMVKSPNVVFEETLKEYKIKTREC